MGKPDSSGDAREELASVAASLRAYLELQQDTGAMGIPRKPRGVKAEAGAGASTSTSPSPSTSTSTSTSMTTTTTTAAEAPRATAPLHVPVPVPAPVPARAPAPTAALRPLPVVAAEAKSCTKCALAATRTNVVFSRGNPEAKLVFVGEAPGADEDEQGLPFVGRAGQLLDKMIGAMGLDPAKDVYVCNIIKCRPPGNRKPEPIEVETCIPYLHEQLAAVDPKAIVALGNTAVAALLNTKLGITKVRGQWKLYRGKIPVMPTYHPSYLLRPSAQQIEAKKQAWEDLQAVMKELGLVRK
jgi:uracil-DNA glycosylase family 4